CQTLPKAAIGEQVVGAIDEVLFQQVVRVPLTAATLHGELEAPLVREGRVRGLLAVEHDLERRILAPGQPEMPAGVQLYIERYGVAGRGDIGEHTGWVLFVAAILGDGAEGGLEGGVEWLGRF